MRLSGSRFVTYEYVAELESLLFRPGGEKGTDVEPRNPDQAQVSLCR
jgi:hypothetical protein